MVLKFREGVRVLSESALRVRVIPVSLDEGFALIARYAVINSGSLTENSSGARWPTALMPLFVQNGFVAWSVRIIAKTSTKHDLRSTSPGKACTWRRPKSLKGI